MMDMDMSKSVITALINHHGLPEGNPERPAPIAGIPNPRFHADQTQGL